MMKCILFYGTAAAGKPFGTSEVHYFLPSNDFTACQAATAKLVTARNQLMGTGIKFFGFRMSVDGQPRNAKFVSSESLVSTGADKKTGDVNPNSTPADIPNTCLVVRATHNNQRHKQVYLTGIPDEIIETNPVGPNLKKGDQWYQKFKAWTKMLREGGTWGFKARTINPVSTNVVDYVSQQAGAGYLGAVVTNDIANVGDRVQLRKVQRINPALPKVNGIYYVSEKAVDAVAGTFTYYLRNTSDLSPDNIGDPGTIELVTYQGYAYTCLRISGQSSRKRGVGSLRPRGRSRNQPT